VYLFSLISFSKYSFLPAELTRRKEQPQTPDALFKIAAPFPSDTGRRDVVSSERETVFLDSFSQRKQPLLAFFQSVPPSFISSPIASSKDQKSLFGGLVLSGFLHSLSDLFYFCLPFLSSHSLNRVPFWVFRAAWLLRSSTRPDHVCFQMTPSSRESCRTPLFDIFPPRVVAITEFFPAARTVPA